MTSKGESVTTDIYPRASFGAITNWGDKKCGGERECIWMTVMRGSQCPVREAM